MKRLKNLLVLSIIPILLISMVLVTPVLADAPVVYSFPTDETLPLQNPCGFEISVHTYGTWKWDEFYNQTGQLVRVQAMWGPVKQTWSAHGKSLVVGMNSSGHAELSPDLTYYIVTWAGRNFFVTVPGYGPVYGSTGNITSMYSYPDIGTFISLIRNVGNPWIENWGPICAYLAP